MASHAKPVNRRIKFLSAWKIILLGSKPVNKHFHYSVGIPIPLRKFTLVFLPHVVYISAHFCIARLLELKVTCRFNHKISLFNVTP